MRFSTLISPVELQGLIDDRGPLVVLDASFDFEDRDIEAGARAFRDSHVPGARYVHVDRDLSAAPTGRDGRHPLPSRERFAERVGAWGITPATQVVVCDRQGGVIAARAWWMLRWLGHASVAVLDGGVPAWVRSGHAVEAGDGPASASPAVDPATDVGAYPLAPPLNRDVDADTLAARLDQVFLLDARAPECSGGEAVPMHARAGHIPGAHGRSVQLNLQPDGRFKPPAELRAEFDALLHGGVVRDHVVHTCGSGVTACHNLLAMEVAGITGSALYAGSWSDWSSDPARPIGTGANPG